MEEGASARGHPNSGPVPSHFRVDPETRVIFRLHFRDDINDVQSTSGNKFRQLRYQLYDSCVRVAVLHYCWSFCAGTPAARGHDVRLRARAYVSISRTGTSLVVLPESGQYALETAQLIVQLCKITLPEGEEEKLMEAPLAATRNGGQRVARPSDDMRASRYTCDAMLRPLRGMGTKSLRALIYAPGAKGFVVRPVEPTGRCFGQRVILLGDATHVMLFAGPGVNLAMANGADLDLALAKAKTDSELLEHVREYDTAMQERTREE
ncbi:hypothetical protein F5888DRAFT_1636560 [Russula emetica]|nr:hypothetical protein F5888DRAFT_1636560 [Russula emetica]